MRPDIPFHGLALSIAALSVAAASQPADAASFGRRLIQNPTGVCQSALPVFDGQIRKRPKAVQNEGSGPAFVTCSWTSQGTYGSGAGENPYRLVVNFSNIDGLADTVACSLVLGNASSSYPVITKTANLAAGNSGTSLAWTVADFGGGDEFPHGLLSMSCVLNPGVGINDSIVNFYEAIGTG